jgi:hypothetical protein
MKTAHTFISSELCSQAEKAGGQKERAAECTIDEISVMTKSAKRNQKNEQS